MEGPGLGNWERVGYPGDIRVGDYVSELVFSMQELFIFLCRSIYVTTCKVFDWSGKFLLRCYVSFTHGNMNNCKFFT